MFASFARKALDPPFTKVAVDCGDVPPGEAGELLKKLLESKGVNTNDILTCECGGLASVEGAAEFYESDNLAVLSTGAITNPQDLVELYNLSEVPQSTGELLAALYDKEFTDMYGDCSDQPMTAVACCEGSWAFMMYDAESGYFLAARSADGAQPLHWGLADANDNVVLISSVKDGLSDFPPGCLFESHGDATGDLENFTRHNPRRRHVNAVPKVDSHGHLCALTYTTPSGHDLLSMARQPAT